MMKRGPPMPRGPRFLLEERKVVRAPGLPLRERCVRLPGVGRLGLDARAVAQRDLRARVEDLLLDEARAGHEDQARAVAGADDDVVGPGRAVEEIPGLERPLLALDDRERLAGEHEEVLLVRLVVVHATALAGLENGERVAELSEGRVLALEDRRC